MAFVDNKFKNTSKWPAQSPDLSPLDYSVNNYIKDKVSSSLADVSKPDDVRRAIKEAWKNMPRSYIAKVIDHFPKRLKECVKARGAYMEHKM